ncbi:50S ribosomal protein L19e [Candidatus Micrarchaeota archaeon]|nr:50S ribosomal protein L19e [Candidatus Micrarchaeota archaeon]
MSLQTVKRIASYLLKAGESRIKIKPEEIKRVKEALTRDDVRSLIKEGIIFAEKKRGVSRALAKIKLKKKQKGRRRGFGSRKGTKYSRISRKRIWINKVRAQRYLLRELQSNGKIKENNYRSLYKMVKGRAFKSKEGMLTYLKENNLVSGKL